MRTLSRYAPLAAASLLLTAQTIDPSEVRVSSAPYTPPLSAAFRAQSSLVEIGVIVRDGKGAAVDGLQKEDFAVHDSGHLRELAGFTVIGGVAPPAASAVAPRRSIALLLDNYVSQMPGRLRDTQLAGLRYLKEAAISFASKTLQPGDSFLVCSASEGQTGPFSSNSAEVSAAILKIEPHFADLRISSQDTLNAVEQLVGYMAKLPGDRRILLASSGNFAELFDRPWASAKQHSIVARALAAGVVIDAIDGKGLYPDPPPGGSVGSRRMAIAQAQSSPRALLDRSNDPLTVISYGSGGAFFHNDNDLAGGFQQIVEPAVRYLLAIPPAEIRDGRFHPLKVKVTRPGHHYEVEARPGYTAAEDADSPAAQPTEIDRQVTSAKPVSGVPVIFAVELSKLDTGESAVLTGVHVDLKAIRFAERDGLSNQKITFIVALFDRRGTFLIGKRGAIDLALKPATHDRLLAVGVNATLTLPAAPGAYSLRAVLQENNEGRIAAVTREVVVPK